MNTADFLETLRSRDIQVWAEGAQLKCSAPPGALSVEFREELRHRKRDILRFLDTAESLVRQQRAIVPLQPRGTRVSIFAVAGHNGDVFCYRTLASYLGDDQPFFGLQPPGLDGQSEPMKRVEDLAGYFAEQITAFQPDGPYVIAGFCAGGSTAFELAQQLIKKGATINAVALFGAPFASSYRFASQMRLRLETQWARVSRHYRNLTTLTGADRKDYFAQKLRLILPSNREKETEPNVEKRDSETGAEVMARRVQVQRATFAALARYRPNHFSGKLTLFLPCKSWAHSSREPLRWRFFAENVEERYGPDDCHTDVMLLEPHAAVFAKLFNEVIGCKDRGASSKN